jgi:hypothetical protein
MIAANIKLLLEKGTEMKKAQEAKKPAITVKPMKVASVRGSEAMNNGD